MLECSNSVLTANFSVQSGQGDYQLNPCCCRRASENQVQGQAEMRIRHFTALLLQILGDGPTAYICLSLHGNKLTVITEEITSS